MEYRSEAEWSFEQAKAEHGALSTSEGSSPCAPIFRWAAMRELEALENEFKETKNGFALLAAVKQCATRDIVMPAWLAFAYIERYNLVLSCTADSWDTAFGRPYPKGKHLSALRKARVNRIAVHGAVRIIREMEPETAIDKGLFERVGKPLGLGSTLTESLYYEAVSMLGEKKSKKNAAPEKP